MGESHSHRLQCERASLVIGRGPRSLNSLSLSLVSQCLHSRGHAHRALRPEKLVFATEAEEAPIKVLTVGLGVCHLLPTALPYCGELTKNKKQQQQCNTADRGTGRVPPAAHRAAVLW